jgi:glycosyltransferase involved in cell wall biosynthesis
MSIYSKSDPGLLAKAIVSVFEGNLIPDHFILIADGTLSSELEKVLKEIANVFNIEVIRLTKNVGLALALNYGLKHVKTEWVARADDDDFNLPRRFEAQLPYALDGYDVIGGNILEVDEVGKKLGVRKCPFSQQDIASYIKFRSPFNHMTVIYKRKSVLEVGGYPDLYLKEDYGLWALMYKNGCRFVNVQEVIVHAGSGVGMYARRGGARYIKSEFQLQIFLYRLGVKSSLNALVLFLARSFIFLIPNQLRFFFYQFFLREHES